MAKYWTASMQYSQMSVEELQRKAQESVKNAKNKGKEMHPIIVEGRQIAKSWWGMAWCKNIEQYADYASRIERGKRYVRSGAVVDLQIVKGKVKARVQGTRKTPYKVEINISPLKEEVCEDIIGKCSSQIQNLQELVNGQFPESLKEIFLSLSCKEYVMTAKDNAVINELNEKIERLIKLYISSLDKNREKDTEIKELRDRIERMKSENIKLHEEIKTLKVATAISTGEGSTEAKSRISQLVREIDKCIALLNN